MVSLCLGTLFLVGDGGVSDLRFRVVRQSSFPSFFFSGYLWSAFSLLFPATVHSRTLACLSPGLLPVIFDFVSHHSSPRFVFVLQDSFRLICLACQVSSVPPHCSKSDRLLFMCWYEQAQGHTHLPTRWLFCSPRHTVCSRQDVQPAIPSARSQPHDEEHSTILNTPPSS